jgi:adenylate kinase
MADVTTVLFIGKPGSGKGTQAKLLSEKTGWPVLVSGDMFRALAKEDSFEGRKTKQENDAGLLAPDWWATYFFQKSILAHPHEAGVIFDGFGRKVPEAKTVIEVLRWLERPFFAVHIKVSDKEIKDRLTKRSEVSGRADDHAVDKRLEEYRVFTEPSVEVFRDAGALLEIEGEGSVEDIHARVLSALGLA